MKARIPLNRKLKRQIDESVKEEYQKQGQDMTRRIFKLFCVSLHNKFGFGSERLSRLLFEVTEQTQKSKTDEVYWYHIDRELKQIGLEFENENYEVMDK